MRQNLYQTPERDHVHKPLRQAVGEGAFLTANPLRLSKPPEARRCRSERIEAPRHPERTRSPYKRPAKAAGRPTTTGISGRLGEPPVIHPDIRANGLDWQCDDCMPNHRSSGKWFFETTAPREQAEWDTGRRFLWGQPLSLHCLLFCTFTRPPLRCRSCALRLGKQGQSGKPLQSHQDCRPTGRCACRARSSFQRRLKTSWKPQLSASIKAHTSASLL